MTKKKTKANKIKQSAFKKSQTAAECNAIAIVYSIESDKHPFHHLDGQFASIAIERVFDLAEEDVILNNKTIKLTLNSL